MCGLVGVVSKAYNGFNTKERDIFNELLFIDTLRGDDSTGVMMVDSNGNLDMAKEASTAGYFQAAPEYQALLQRSFREGAAMFGHNRKATRGNITDENAHPFVVDNRYVLMHNGTMYGDHKKIADVEVDSHAITHLLHEKGGDAEQMLSELNAAYALIWYDVQERTISLVRNSARPLHYVETHNSWYFASEPGMLAWMMSRHQMTTIDGGIKPLEDGHLMTFKREGRNWEKQVKKLTLTRPAVVTTTAFQHSYPRPVVDACSLPSDRVTRHPYAGVWGDEDWDEAHNQTPARNVLQLPHKETVVESAMRIKQLPHEPERAKREGISISAEMFTRAAIDMSAGTWITAIPFDYEYINPTSSTNGILLYGKVVDNEDILIRCYVPFDPRTDFELGIISMCSAGEKYAFKAMHRSWTSYQNDVNPGAGYGTIYSKEFYKVQEIITPQEVANEQA